MAERILRLLVRRPIKPVEIEKVMQSIKINITIWVEPTEELIASRKIYNTTLQIAATITREAKAKASCVRAVME